MQGKRSRRLLLMLAFLLGLAIFIYPTLSDYMARRSVIRGANTYEEQIIKLSEEEIEQMWKEARAYNDSLNGNPVPDPFIPGSGRVLPDNYLRVLDMEEGIMGYVDIPKIQIYLPIRHGTSDEVLEKGAGHIEQTTLPIGGLGNLSIITAHTGFAGAEMFNRLTELKIKDIFMIHVLDETFTYEVEDIRVILPEEIESLLPVAGEDYVTLVTCTPYGVNSHRLLVRGTRIANIEEVVSVVEEKVFPWKVIGLVAIALLFTLLILVWTNRQGRKKRRREITKGEIRRMELLRKMGRNARKRKEKSGDGYTE
jgi:LPXTG-site transpeptidase (sortase) family protein